MSDMNIPFHMCMARGNGSSMKGKCSGVQPESSFFVPCSQSFILVVNDVEMPESVLFFLKQLRFHTRFF